MYSMEYIEEEKMWKNIHQRSTYLRLYGWTNFWSILQLYEQKINQSFSKQIMTWRSEMSTADLENSLMLQIFWSQDIKRTHEYEECNFLIFSVDLQNCPGTLFFIPFYLLNIFSVRDSLVWFISNNHKSKQKHGKK